MMPLPVSMEPLWKRVAGVSSQHKWTCPYCPWASVSFEEAENHIEDTHCRCGLDSNHWPEDTEPRRLDNSEEG